MNALTQNERNALTRAVLELDVNNHAGVMSHVVGLRGAPTTSRAFSSCRSAAAKPASG